MRLKPQYQNPPAVEQQEAISLLIDAYKRLLRRADDLKRAESKKPRRRARGGRRNS